MSKYTDIMKYLNPKNIIEKTELPNDTARGKYVLKSSIAKSYQEFEQIVIDYMDFHCRQIYNGGSLPPELLRDKADKFLQKMGGLSDSAAYQALSGTDGGMVSILNQLSEKFKEEMKRAYFEYVITTYINPLNFDEMVELMAEFKSKLLNYSPQSFGYIEPAAMAVNYKTIIWNYIDSLTKYKNLWKMY